MRCVLHRQRLPLLALLATALLLHAPSLVTASCPSSSEGDDFDDDGDEFPDPPTPTPYVGGLNPNPLTSITADELSALIALHHAAGGQSWTHTWASWQPLGNIPLPPCRWYGVVCQQFPDGPHVVELNLVGNNLVGSLPDVLGRLYMAVRIDLSNNALTGEGSVDRAPCGCWGGMEMGCLG